MPASPINKVEFFSCGDLFGGVLKVQKTITSRNNVRMLKYSSSSRQMVSQWHQTEQQPMIQSQILGYFVLKPKQTIWLLCIFLFNIFILILLCSVQSDMKLDIALGPGEQHFCFLRTFSTLTSTYNTSRQITSRNQTHNSCTHRSQCMHWNHGGWDFNDRCTIYSKPWATAKPALCTPAVNTHTHYGTLCAAWIKREGEIRWEAPPPPFLGWNISQTLSAVRTCKNVYI